MKEHLQLLAVEIVAVAELFVVVVEKLKCLLLLLTELLLRHEIIQMMVFVMK